MSATKTGDPRVDRQQDTEKHLKGFQPPSRNERLARHLLTEHQATPSDLDNHAELLTLHVAQHVPEPNDATGTVVEDTPGPAQNQPESAPKVDKRSAKQDLARHVVLAMADTIISSDGSELFRSAFSADEAAEIASQWLHHLPTGSDDGRRWWPAELPRPTRSDWT